MIDVTIQNFEAEVIEASMTTPVLVDFWAPWCGPCKSLGPILEKVEEAYAGRFKLVKINSDDEQQLAGAFGIRSIPTCVLLMGDQPVDGFMGALPEGQVKAFLDKHLPPADELPPEVVEEAAAPEPVAAPGSADALPAGSLSFQTLLDTYRTTTGVKTPGAYYTVANNGTYYAGTGSSQTDPGERSLDVASQQKRRWRVIVFGVFFFAYFIRGQLKLLRPAELVVTDSQQPQQVFNRVGQDAKHR